MSSTRMAVVLRRDLNMPAGLLAAQATHTAMLFIQEALIQRRHEGEGGSYSLEIHMEEAEWLKQPYLAVLAVDTPEELTVIKKMAEDEHLPVRVWQDVIPSKVLDGRVLQCVVGISIGPADSDALRKVTGTLPLY
jgi:peptidyl-tRNA hydrolase